MRRLKRFMRSAVVSARIPLVKFVASAITIGPGGSAGREGPTAQISAGFGSWLGDLLHLDDHERRIAVAAGIGSGIGAIFKAPFGGALLSAEILYKRGFEADALFPSFIASVIGFSSHFARTLAGPFRLLRQPRRSLPPRPDARRGSAQPTDSTLPLWFQQPEGPSFCLLNNADVLAVGQENPGAVPFGR
jgi:H+/Cl- antiporter ClcA